MPTIYLANARVFPPVVLVLAFQDFNYDRSVLMRRNRGWPSGGLRMLDIMAAAYRDLLLALMLLAIFKWLSLSICDPSLSFASGWLQNGAVPTGRRGTENEAKTLSSNENSKAAVDKAVQVLIVSYNHEFSFRFFALTGKGVRRILGQDLPKMQKLFPNSL